MGTLLGTNYAEWLQAVPGVKFQGYKDWAQIIPELAIGRTDAALYDQPVVAALMKQHPEWKIEMPADYEPRTFKNPAGYSSYAFRQADIQWRQRGVLGVPVDGVQQQVEGDPVEVGADRLQQLDASA